MHVVGGATLDRWTALSDEEIVARVIEGQTALYEVLMRRYNERIIVRPLRVVPRRAAGRPPGRLHAARGGRSDHCGNRRVPRRQRRCRQDTPVAQPRSSAESARRTGRNRRARGLPLPADPLRLCSCGRFREDRLEPVAPTRARLSVRRRIDLTLAAGYSEHVPRPRSPYI